MFLKTLEETRKSVKKSTGHCKKINFDFTIFQHISRGSWPAKISEDLGISRQCVNYHISSLKERKLVRMRAQGVWEILKNYEPKLSKKSTRVDHEQLGTKFLHFSPNSIRAHAFQFKLWVPRNFRNWVPKERRSELLKKQGIDFQELDHLFGGGQGLTYKGRKIHLTDKTLIIYEKASYFADKSELAQSRALLDVLKLIKSFEREIGANFGVYEQYRLKVTRQHYSLIKNALAAIYNKPKRQKLEVSDGRGQWLLIDNSWNLEELECVHPETGVPDSEGMQGWMNSMKRTNFKVTPDLILDNFKETRKLLEETSEINLESSKKQLATNMVIKQIDANVRQLVRIVAENQRRGENGES